MFTMLFHICIFRRSRRAKNRRARYYLNFSGGPPLETRNTRICIREKKNANTSGDSENMKMWPQSFYGTIKLNEPNWIKEIWYNTVPTRTDNFWFHSTLKIMNHRRIQFYSPGSGKIKEKTAMASTVYKEVSLFLIISVSSLKPNNISFFLFWNQYGMNHLWRIP